MSTLMSIDLGMSLTWLWFFVAVFFAVIEAITLGIISIWFAIGALVTMFVAFFIDSFIVQLFVFIVISLILVATTRKVAVDKLRIGQVKTNVEELIGKEAIVTKEIKPHLTGEVKVEGKIWRARSESQHEYQVNELVLVLRIEGVTIVVK